LRAERYDSNGEASAKKSVGEDRALAFVLRFGGQIRGQVRLVVNQYIHADARDTPVPQENRQRRFALTQLVIRNSVVDDHVLDTQTLQHLGLGEAEREPNLKELFGKAL
jgi:hypothetical protein